MIVTPIVNDLNILYSWVYSKINSPEIENINNYLSDKLMHLHVICAITVLLIFICSWCGTTVNLMIYSLHVGQIQEL